MFVCLCFGISDKQVKQWLDKKTVSCLRDLKSVSKAGSSCGSCLVAINEIIQSQKDDELSDSESGDEDCLKHKVS